MGRTHSHFTVCSYVSTDAAAWETSYRCWPPSREGFSAGTSKLKNTFTLSVRAKVTRGNSRNCYSSWVVLERENTASFYIYWFIFLEMSSHFPLVAVQFISVKSKNRANSEQMHVMNFFTDACWVIDMWVEIKGRVTYFRKALKNKMRLPNTVSRIFLCCLWFLWKFCQVKDETVTKYLTEVDFWFQMAGISTADTLWTSVCSLKNHSYCGTDRN